MNNLNKFKLSQQTFVTYHVPWTHTVKVPLVILKCKQWCMSNQTIGTRLRSPCFVVFKKIVLMQGFLRGKNMISNASFQICNELETLWSSVTFLLIKMTNRSKPFYLTERIKRCSKNILVWDCVNSGGHNWFRSARLNKSGHTKFERTYSRGKTQTNFVTK